MAKHSQYSVIGSRRANYFIKGSPVQFVLTELLREEDTGDVLVTFSFKNILDRMLTYCKIHFICKDELGNIIAEEDFLYDGLTVQDGEVFGSNEAVFVSAEKVSSIENTVLEIAFDNGRKYDISNSEIVRLPELKKLSEMMVGVVGAALNSTNVVFRPAQLAEGWQCTCGAFNYNAGRGTSVCVECGQGKAALFSAVRSAEAPTNEGTRVFSAVGTQQPAQLDETRAFSAPTPSAQKSQRAPTRYSIMSDSTADFINKFVPIMAALASVLFVLSAFILRQILL